MAAIVTEEGYFRPGFVTMELEPRISVRVIRWNY